MIKRQAFEVDSRFYSSVLVVGVSGAASELYRYLKETEQFTHDQLKLSDRIESGYSMVVLVDLPQKVYRSDDCDALVTVTHAQCYGLSESQKILSSYDWQSIRNIERELQTMKKQGVYSMSKPTDDLIIYKDWLRQRVDREIGTDET